MVGGTHRWVGRASDRSNFWDWRRHRRRVHHVEDHGVVRSRRPSMSQLLARLPGHGFIAEPELKFHPERAQDVHTHPLKGLAEFGPYSRSVLGSVSDPIRLALVAPSDGVAHMHDL